MDACYFLCLLLAVVAKACENNGPLGMISGEIQDWQITASSAYPSDWDQGCAVKNARLYEDNSKGWCTYYKSSSEWIQIDLGTPTTVTGVMTVGRGDGKEWVKSYYLSYSDDGVKWFYVLDQTGSRRVFEGNSDSYSVQHAYLEEYLHTRYVKLHPRTWNRHPSMRLELLGCQDSKHALGLRPYGRFRASTTHPFRKGSSCQADDANIDSSKAWCSKESDRQQWLQIDVGPPSLVTAVITRGRGDTKRNHWVTRYTLEYSNDTKIWNPYKESQKTGHDKIQGTKMFQNRQLVDGTLEFGGNMDKQSKRVHYLKNPFVARYIRFKPTEWKGSIAMRAGLLGRPPTGECGEGFLRINAKSPCVENLAYKKAAYISDSKHSKRNLKARTTIDLVKAVDGIVPKDRSSCTVLESDEKGQARFTIDLKEKQDISGVVLALWHSDKRGTSDDEVRNINSIRVFVEEKKEDRLCAQLKNVNGALYQDRLHLPCTDSRRGRFLRLVIDGKLSVSWAKKMTAVICEVMAYS